jgi:hypothetical protein
MTTHESEELTAFEADDDDPMHWDHGQLLREVGRLRTELAARDGERAFILEALIDFEKLAKAGNSSQQAGANAVIAGLRAAMKARDALGSGH